MFRCFFVVFMTMLLVSCTIKKQDHGYDFDNEVLKNFKVKTSTKHDVQKIMGSPSAVSVIDKNVWYYISLKTKSIAILKPKINNYKVLELKFDKQGKLSEMLLYTNDKIKKLDFKKWESPLRGSNDSSLSDFFYNIGRFNKATNKS